jgi:hypothetical protein
MAGCGGESLCDSFDRPGKGFFRSQVAVGIPR